MTESSLLSTEQAVGNLAGQITNKLISSQYFLIFQTSSKWKAEDFLSQIREPPPRNARQSFLFSGTVQLLRLGLGSDSNIMAAGHGGRWSTASDKLKLSIMAWPHKESDRNTQRMKTSIKGWQPLTQISFLLLKELVKCDGAAHKNSLLVLMKQLCMPHLLPC